METTLTKLAMPDYQVNTDRILGNTSNDEGKQKGRIHCRFQLLVGWPEEAKREINPFCYRGDQFPNIETPEQMLRSLLRNFQKNYEKDRWVYAYLFDTLYLKDDERRVILAYANGAIEQHRLHNYYMMLQDFRIIDFLRTEKLDAILRAYA
jgi:hypothetical protein